MIDIEKFICSLMEQDKGAMYFGNIALKKQGFKYKDGAIVEIEPKQELTEFENRLCEIVDAAMQNPVDNPNTIIFDVKKKLAPELLELAQKQLQQEFDKQLGQAYKDADEVQYKRGYRKAVEDAREWLAWYTCDREVTLDRFDDGMEQKLKELSQG